MKDEPDMVDIKLEEKEVIADEPEYVECETGQVIFPYGAAYYSAIHGFNSLFIAYKTGAITGEDSESGKMTEPERKRGILTLIK